MARSRYASFSVPDTKASKNEAGRLTATDYAALPILRSPDKEAALVKYILDRVTLADEERRDRAMRAETIDRQLSGYIQHSADDKKRQQDIEAGKTPKPPDHNLPLAEGQIEDAITYLMSIYAPEIDIFEAVAAADKQQMAKAVVAELNKQGQRGQYYRHIAKALNNGLKYNLGGLTCYWEKNSGKVFKSGLGGMVSTEQGTLWEGNLINSVDIYNFFYDTSVHPVDVPLQGEYFAEVELKTPFRIRKMAEDKQLFGIERYVNDTKRGIYNGIDSKSFYIDPPSVRANMQGQKRGWKGVFRGQQVQESTPGIELLKWTGWVRPSEHGLSQDTDYQVWRIIIANGACITFAAQLENAHGMLPISLLAPKEDDLRNSQKSHAEQLLPLQHFASFLLNSHQTATRKSIYGITIFDANKFPGFDAKRDDLVGAKLGYRSSGTDTDIDKIFRHYNDAPGTEHNVEQLAQIIDLMQKILPTDMLKQVADLERATLYQAAATVQAGNRRQLKLARIISDQCLQVLKFQMVYNLYANFPTLSYIDPETGERVDISIGELIDAGIEYDIATGLKGIDRLMILQIVRDAVNMIIQSQQGTAEIDIVALLNYFTSLAGDRTDLTQFRRKTPAIGPDGKPIPPEAPTPPGTEIPKP